MSEELYNYLSHHLRKEIKNLDGFMALGNEVDRQKRLQRFLDEIILWKHKEHDA